jgi:hypothetical protein
VKNYLAQVTGTVGNDKKLITATGNSRPLCEVSFYAQYLGIEWLIPEIKRIERGIQVKNWS